MSNPWLLALVAAYLGYASKRRACIAVLDPLQLLAVKEAVWTYTVADLFNSGAATAGEAEVFAVSICVWWSVWFVLTRLWGAAYRRMIHRLWTRVDAATGRDRRIVTGYYVIAAIVIFLFTVAGGGGGDNRLVIAKTIRPIEGFTSLLSPFVFFWLMRSTSRVARVALVLLAAVSVYVGGKGALLTLLLPFSALILLGIVRVRPRQLIILGTALGLGFYASAALNYGSTDLVGVLSLLSQRIILDGDVYLVALPNGLIYETTTTRLGPYLFGPLLKALALPVQIDVNVGSQMLSLLFGFETPNGPNPQWPIVMLGYGITSLWRVAAYSALFFTLTVVLRVKLMSHRFVSIMPLSLTLPLMSFSMQYAALAFTDPSFPFIYLVHAFFVSAVMSASFFFLAWLKNRKPHGVPVRC